MHVQKYIELWTQIHMWRTDKMYKNISVPGQNARTHVNRVTYTQIHMWRTDKTEKILGRHGKMHCPLSVSREMKTFWLLETTITLTGGGGEEKDDPQRLRKGETGTRWSSGSCQSAGAGWGQRWDGCSGWLNPICLCDGAGVLNPLPP